MQIRHRRRIGAVAVLCAALGVAGCTGSAKPAHTFTPTSTFSDPRGTGGPVSSSPSVATTGPNVRPGEKPPVLPAAGRTNTILGATEFAKYWIEALDWGYATTDSSLAKQSYSSSCSDCALFMQNFDDARAKHEHFRGGRIHIDEWIIADNDRRDGATQAVDVTFSAEGLMTIDASGRVVQSEPAVAQMTFRLWLARKANSWTVVQKGTVQ